MNQHLRVCVYVIFVSACVYQCGEGSVEVVNLFPYVGNRMVSPVDCKCVSIESIKGGF